jgi:hypothetical protein
VSESYYPRHSLESLTRRAEAAEAELEQYRVRLAGALTAAEGHFTRAQRDEPGVLGYVRHCPTIDAVLVLRERADAAEEREKEFADAWRAEVAKWRFVASEEKSRATLAERERDGFRALSVQEGVWRLRLADHRAAERELAVTRDERDRLREALRVLGCERPGGIHCGDAPALSPGLCVRCAALSGTTEARPTGDAGIDAAADARIEALINRQPKRAKPTPPPCEECNREPFQTLREVRGDTDDRTLTDRIVAAQGYLRLGTWGARPPCEECERKDEALREAVAAYCHAACPSVWVTQDRHLATCKRLRAALSPPRDEKEGE